MLPIFLPFWIDSHNPAGLEYLTEIRTSQAEVWVSAAQGGWVDYYQGDESVEWGAQTASLYRVNERLTLQGEVSYLNRTAQHETGSVFIEPWDMPFDLVEYNRDRAGETQLEDYRLLGGIGGKVGHGLRWGLRADMVAANLAKRRDLRHQNRLMQMTLTPGVVWQVTERTALGMSYAWRRSVEGVSFNIAGTSDEDYYTLVAYGGFYGIKQLATSYDGYASTSNGMIPLVDERHAWSVQYDLQANERLTWHNEWTGTLRSGYYGRESLYSVVYTDHEGVGLQWESGIELKTTARRQHRWHWAVQWEELNNRENLYNEVQEGGGLSRIVYQDKMQRLSRHDLTASARYQMLMGEDDEQPRWSLSAEMSYARRNDVTTFFPLERRQTIEQYQAAVRGAHGWKTRQGGLEVALKTAYHWGGGTRVSDKQLSGGTATTYATSLDRYLQHQYDYLTTGQWIVELGIQYERPLPQWKIVPYAALRAERRQAADIGHIGHRYHEQCGAVVGVRF